MCESFLTFTPPHGQLYAGFRGFISISGGWVLLCRELSYANKHTCAGHTRLLCMEHMNDRVHVDRQFVIFYLLISAYT